MHLLNPNTWSSKMAFVSDRPPKRNGIIKFTMSTLRRNVKKSKRLQNCWKHLFWSSKAGKIGTKKTFKNISTTGWWSKKFSITKKRLSVCMRQLYRHRTSQKQFKSRKGGTTGVNPSLKSSLKKSSKKADWMKERKTGNGLRCLIEWLRWC